MKKIFVYLPHVLSVMITAFFALFILEGFDPNFGWQSGLIHFFQAFIVFAMTVLAWKRPMIGGWFFIILGIYFWHNMPLAAVFIVTGILFLYTTKKKQLR